MFTPPKFYIAYVQATEELSESEAYMEALRDQIPAEQSSRKAAASPVTPETHGMVKKLKREVADPKEKLVDHDEELRALKVNSAHHHSPIDSMTVASLELRLKKKETELQNEGNSTARLLQEQEKLKKALETLRSDYAKLSRWKKTIGDYSKQQSEKILNLRTELQKKVRLFVTFYSQEFYYVCSTVAGIFFRCG